MAIDLPQLPYALNALEPHISLETLTLHHGKHHMGYVKKLNELIEDTDLAAKSLEEIVQATAGDAKRMAVFNNAAQAWNHSFLWRSMEPGATGTCSKAVAERIRADFGGPKEFDDQFVKAAMGQFGSGWVWLVEDAGKLKILSTSNAITPIGDKKLGKPLAVMDVWEHAYYVDYRNRREEYASVFLKHLLNWRFVDSNLGVNAQPMAA